ncbi:CsbD family protein [Acidisoma silvae]|uniref:CsbD family protein n=1 Tax=Acidisoma silvae TaxID=2802396 RepID=A0A963YTN6_9PROT|nr:CsbD family protein [Acidisoma silvae]MCB8876504.1 CsbD family protein [Acidisoma silvae]
MGRSTFSSSARDTAGRIQDAVGDFADDAQDEARRRYRSARGQAEGYVEEATDRIREQPLVAGLAILAIGYLLGRLRIL